MYIYIERAVSKLGSMEYAQLITFHGEALTSLFLMNIYKRRKGTQARPCCSDIC